MSFPRSSPVWRRYSDLPRSPFRDHPSPPPQKNFPQKERSPARHRRSPGMGSLVRNGSSYRTRSPVREKLEVHKQSQTHERSRPHAKDKVTHRVKSPRLGRSRSPLKEKLSQRNWSLKHVKSRSPTSGKPRQRTGSPSQMQSRSPAKQRPLENARLPKQVRSSSPVRTGSSGSPPRTKRLRHAQVEKTLYRDEGRSIVRDHDKGRNRERGKDRDALHEGRLAHGKGDVGTSRSSRHAHGHSISPVDISHRSGYSPRSPSRASKAAAHDEVTERRDEHEQHQHGDQDSISKMKAAEEALKAKPKQKPSFELSGKLAEETNRVRGVTLLFTEPPEAHRPDIRWRLYVFKAGEVLNEPLYVHRQSCYLFGRERRVADIPTDHPSCSKQHAVLQYRRVEKEHPDGLSSKQVRPYLMDLGSTNGTSLNDERIEPQRYYELCEKDVIKFGNSSREYVILHENSAK